MATECESPGTPDRMAAPLSQVSEEMTIAAGVEAPASPAPSSAAHRAAEQQAAAVAGLARAERQRLRAVALREARLVARSRSQSGIGPAPVVAAAAAEVDTGGGFFAPAPGAGAGAGPGPGVGQQPGAPLVHASEQPRCVHCSRRFAQSYLLDAFGHEACDACRDHESHALVTRTDAKAEFLLQDCDLDLRPPPLRCVRRPNPHRARFADMRLYLRAQVERRALDVWGSPGALQAERERRAERAERARRTAERRRLRELRLTARSGLFARRAPPHEHEFGPERHDAAADTYSRECSSCGHVHTYEKM